MQEDDFATELLPSLTVQTPAFTPAPQAPTPGVPPSCISPTLTPAVASPTLTRAFPPTDGAGGTFTQDSWETQAPNASTTATEGQVPAL